MAAIPKYQKLIAPFSDKHLNAGGLLSNPWQSFFQKVVDFLSPLGQEKHAEIEPANGLTYADVTGMKFDSATTSFAAIDYLVQIVTTGTSAATVCHGGTFYAIYNPTLDSWDLLGLGDQTPREFTAATTDICTATAHGFYPGQKVQLSTLGTLPGGLTRATDYWVIPLTENTFSLASSFDNFLSGTVVDITSTGSGSHFAYPHPSVIFNITATGQVQYLSFVSGVKSISRIVWRDRTLAARHSSYSSLRSS